MASMGTSKGNKRPKTVTGIEFGDRIVRVATIHFKGDRVQIKSVSQAAVHQGRKGVKDDIRSGKIAALKEALSKHTRDLGTVIVGIPREDVITRMVSLPSGEANEVREMLFFDVERYLPFPVEEAEISYRILEQIGENESRVLIVAARRSDLYQVLDDLDEIGLMPDRIDVDAHGCGYSCSRNGHADSTPFAVLHLDLYDSFAGLVVDGQLRFSRSLGTGTDDFNLEGSGGTPDLAGITKKLKRSLAGFAHEEYGSHPEKLVLTGPGTQTPGIQQYLFSEFNLPVVLQEGIEGDKSDEAASPFISAIGLALEEAECDHHINLIPEEVYQKYEAAHRKRFLVNASFLLFINLALAAGIVGHGFWHKQQILAVIDSKIQKIQPSLKDIDKIAEQLAVIDKNIDRENSAFKVLTELYEITPDRVRFDRLDFAKSDKVTMDFETFEYRDINDYKAILSKSPFFAGAIEGGNASTQNADPQKWKFKRTQKVRALEIKLRTNREFTE